MLLDVAKYVLTIIAIGGFVTGHLDEGAVLFSVILSCATMFIGFLTIPEEEK